MQNDIIHIIWTKKKDLTLHKHHSATTETIENNTAKDTYYPSLWHYNTQKFYTHNILLQNTNRTIQYKKTQAVQEALNFTISKTSFLSPLSSTSPIV